MTFAIASGTGVGVQILSTILQSYLGFKKNNVELFFEKLMNSEVDLSRIGEIEEIQRHFFSVIDDVSKEANLEKIEAWKNAVIHLATDFSNFDYVDNFIKILSDLTVFDLTVLYKAYDLEVSSKTIEQELIAYFETKGVKIDYTVLSLKRLASHNLVTESYSNHFTYNGTKDAPLKNFMYSRNELGREFLIFVSNLEDETDD